MVTVSLGLWSYATGIFSIFRLLAQSAEASEYTDCFFVEGLDSSNECTGYKTQQSNDEDPLMLELWGMQSTPLLPSLSGPLWLWEVAPDRILSMGHIKLFEI